MVPGEDTDYLLWHVDFHRGVLSGKCGKKAPSAQAVLMDKVYLSLHNRAAPCNAPVHGCRTVTFITVLCSTSLHYSTFNQLALKNATDYAPFRAGVRKISPLQRRRLHYFSNCEEGEQERWYRKYIPRHTAELWIGQYIWYTSKNFRQSREKTGSGGGEGWQIRWGDSWRAHIRPIGILDPVLSKKQRKSARKMLKSTWLLLKLKKQL